MCDIYVGGDNDFNVQAMITRLMWTIRTSLSTVRERPLNLITHSLTLHSNPLQWRHNGRGSVSNHQPHDCLLNRWFRRRSKKTSKLRVTGLPGTGEFPEQMAGNSENVSIWWRHHDTPVLSVSSASKAQSLWTPYRIHTDSFTVTPTRELPAISPWSASWTGMIRICCLPPSDIESVQGWGLLNHC